MCPCTNMWVETLIKNFKNIFQTSALLRKNSTGGYAKTNTINICEAKLLSEKFAICKDLILPTTDKDSYKT